MLRKLPVLLVAVAACGTGERRSAANPQCDEGNGGITLPPGFCASVFADEVGVARHLVVTPAGDVYVALEDSRRSSANSTKVSGENGRGGMIALRDTNADGRADIRFRSRRVALRHGVRSLLYSSSVATVRRYRLDRLARTVVARHSRTGFPDNGGHSVAVSTR